MEKYCFAARVDVIVQLDYQFGLSECYEVTKYRGSNETCADFSEISPDGDGISSLQGRLDAEQPNKWLDKEDPK